jgi:hypothetical protein
MFDLFTVMDIGSEHAARRESEYSALVVLRISAESLK